MNKFNEQVQRGAALLDERVPGWRKDVSTSRLLEQGTRTVLSELFGTYTRGCVLLGVTHAEAVLNGFSPARVSDGLALQRAWIEYLRPEAKVTVELTGTQISNLFNLLSLHAEPELYTACGGDAFADVYGKVHSGPGLSRSRIAALLKQPPKPGTDW